MEKQKRKGKEISIQIKDLRKYINLIIDKQFI